VTEDSPVAEEGAPRPSRSPGEPSGSFGDEAAEMANETEVEEGFETGAGAPSSATGGGAGAPSSATGGGDGAPSSATGDEPGEPAGDQVAALTADLQRLQAEYLNYKRRVDRDRDLVRENATYAVLAPITEVLDTIDRAREHGELEGGLKTVAEQLERVVSAQGLTKFGEPGDTFDPTLHEALSHIGEDPAVSVTTCKIVAKAGYRIGERVVRAAQVLVVDPADPTPAASAGPGDSSETAEPGE
jgi:molecular chaperone GrpE